jgi:hypothetical protein
MNKKTVLATCVLLTLASAGCSGLTGPGIMQTDPADPAGSASIGTGSVTSNSMIAPEAWSAGIGLGP